MAIHPATIPASDLQRCALLRSRSTTVRREVLALLQSPRLAGGSLLASLLIAGVSLPQNVAANPHNGTVTAGNAIIVSATPERLDVVQSSDRAIINWQGFSIGQGEQTNFQQPSAASVTLNRVTGQQASEIAGSLTANGTVMLINPNGVLIGKTGKVDVGGLVATTADIKDEDFLAQRMNFNQASPHTDATVRNEGDISIKEQGLAALVAPNVQNSGVIAARLGRVALGGGQTFSLDFHGDGLLSFSAGSAVTTVPRDAQGAAMQALVTNSGRIVAAGGTVQLSASAVKGVIDQVINTSGVIEARSVGMQGGTIILSGGDNGTVAVSGMLDASSPDSQGGTVRIAGDSIAIGSEARINTSGSTGGGIIDIGRDVNGELAGDVRINRGAQISADAIANGDGGDIVVLSSRSTGFAGTMSARGGASSGDGGDVEISSHDQIGLSGSVDLNAPHGATGNLLLDPATLTIVDSGAGTAQQDAAAGDGVIAAGDANTPDNTLSRGTLEALTGNANVTLEAVGQITVNAMAGGVINLQTDASHSFTLRSTTSGGIYFVDANTEIRTQGGDIFLQALKAGALLNLGKLTSNGGDIGLTAGGTVQLANLIDAGAGNVAITSLAGSIFNTGSPNATGASVTLDAAYGSVGTALAPINTNAAGLTLATGGNLYVDNDIALTQLAISSVHTVATPFVYVVDAPQLNFDVTDTGTDYLLNNIVNGGNLVLRLQGDRNLVVGDINAAAGDVTLISTAGAIRDDGNLATGITGDDLTLTATGAIGTNANVLTSTVASLAALAGSGSGVFVSNTGTLNLISLVANNTSNIATTGNLTTNLVTAAGTTLGLTSSAGSVFTNGGPNDTIAVQSLNLTSADAAGTVGTPIRTSATQLSATAVNGIYANTTGSTALGTVVTTNGPIAIGSTGNMTVDRVDASAAGTVTLTATNGSISASTARDNVLANTFNFAATASNGAVNLGTAASTMTGTSGTGGITLRQNGATTLASLISTGAVNVSAAAGTVTLNTLRGTNVTVSAATGNLIDDGNTGTFVTATTGVNLSSTLGIVGTTTQHLQTHAPQLTLLAGSNTFVDSDLALTALTITNNHTTPGVANLIEVTAPYLQFNVTDNGSQFQLTDITGLTLNTLSFTGDQTSVVTRLRAPGTITVRATQGDVLNDGDGNTRIAGGAIVLTSNHGSLGTAAANGALDINTSSLNATTGGNLHINDIADLSTLTITSTHENPALDYQYILTAPSLRFDIVDSTAGYALNTMSDASSQTFNFTGDRTITAGLLDVTRNGTITLRSTLGSVLDDGNKNTQILANTVALNSTLGNVGSPIGQGFMDVIARLLNGQAPAGSFTVAVPYPTTNTSSNAAVTLNSISAGGPLRVTVDNGDLRIQTVNVGTNAATLTVSNGSILSSSTLLAGNLTLTASGSMGTSTALLQTQVNGPITANAGGGGLYLNDTQNLSLLTASAAGPMVVSSSGSIGAGAITAGANPVTLTASANLTDDGNAATRITGSAVTLTANTGSLGTVSAAIGVASPALTITSGGNVYADDTTTLNLLSISGTSFSTNRTNLYSMIAPGLTLTATDAGAAGNVTLAALANTAPLTFTFSTQRSLVLGSVDTNVGSATLASVQGSLLDDANAATTISAPTLTLSAGNSLGATGAGNALAIDATTLNLTALRDFYIADSAALSSLTMRSTATGGVTNNFGITAPGQTFTLSDNGSTHYLQTVAGAGLGVFNFRGNKNLNLGTITASGAVTLTGAGTIGMDGVGGSKVSGASVTLDTLNTSNGHIGTAGLNIATGTPVLTINTSGDSYATSDQALTALTIKETHSSTLTDYAGDISATNIANFVFTDGATAALDITATNLNFNYETDRVLQVNTINVGAGGVATLSARGTFQTQAIVDDGNQGTRITAGTVRLTNGTGQGYIGAGGNGDIDVTTANLTVKSSGDVYVSDATTLATLGIEASHSQSGDRTYAISGTGLTFNLADQSFLVTGGQGTVINDVTSATDLNFSFATDRSLQVVTLDAGAGGSVTLQSNSIQDDANSGTKITANALTLLGTTAGSGAGSTLTELDTDVNFLSSTLNSTLALINDGDLTLHANSAANSANLTSLTGSFFSDGVARFTTPNLSLTADHGSLGANGTPLLLTARTVSLRSGYDIYANSALDLLGLTVTSNHDAVRTNTLDIVAPNLTFDIDDIGGNEFDVVTVTDLTGLDFNFTGDKPIRLSTVNVRGGNSLSIRATTGGDAIFDDGDGSTELTGESIALTSAGSIGLVDVVEVNTTNLALNTADSFNVHDNLDLSVLNLTLSPQPGTPTYLLTAANLTFDVTENGTDTTINDITDTTGLALSLISAESQIVHTIDMQRYGTVSLISTGGDITGSGTGTSRITAGNARFETQGGGAIGTVGNPIELSAPLVTLWPTGDMTLVSNTHIDSLTIRSQHGNFGTYSITSPSLTFNVTDDASGATLTNITDTTGLSLNYSSDHDFIVGTVNLGTAGNLTLSGYTGGVDIVGDGDTNTQISAVAVNLTANGGAIGAAGAGNEIEMSAQNFSGFASGGGVIAKFVGPVVINSITAAGGSELVNDLDLSIGSFNANGQSLTVTAGGSILSGSIFNAGTVILSAVGSIGSTSAVSTNANGGTTTLTATAGGSVAVSESWTLNAASVTANGPVTLSSSQGGLSVGTVSAGNNAVTLTTSLGAITGNNGANLITGSAVTLNANSSQSAQSIGTNGTHVRVDTPVLTLNTRGDLYVNDLADLTALTILRSSSSLGSPGGALSVAATNLTFNATDDGNTTTINNISDSTGLNFALQSYSSILVDTLNVGASSDVSLTSQRFNADATIGSVNGGSLLTARNLTVVTSGNSGGAIGTSGTPFRTAVASLNATSQNGGIFVTQSGVLTLNNMQSGGELNITTTSGNLLVGTVSYGNNQPLTLAATAASLLDDGINSTRIVGNGSGAINLSGANGIGTALAPLALTDQSTNTINATVTGAGSAYLDLISNSGSINPLINVTTANGAISVQTTGTMTLSNLVATTDAVGNDIFANARTGNLVLGTVTAGALHGSLDLRAATGAITAVNGSNVISAFDPSLSAATGIGSLATPLNVTGQNVVADTLSGNVYLAPTGIAVLSFVRSQNGLVSVVGTSDIVAANVLSQSGGVTLTTSGANSTIYAGNVNAGSGTVTLAAGNGQIIDDGVLTTRIVGGAGTFTSANAVGSSSTPLQTQLTSLTSTITGTGGLYIDQVGNLALGNLTSGDGAIRIVGANSLSGSGTINAGGAPITLTASGGNALLTGAITTVGADANLAVLNVTGANISVGAATTTGAQTYNGNTSILGNLSGRSFLFDGDLATSGSGVRQIATNASGNAITINGGVDGAGIGLALVATGGTVDIGSDATNLASFAATASQITLLGVTTTGAQTYTGSTAFNGSAYTTSGGAFNATGAAAFGADSAITTGAGGVAFTSTLNGAHNLSIDSSGLTSFGGLVTLASLTTDAPGTLAITGNAVTTTGAQSYGETLTLDGDKTLTGTTVTFGGAVNGTTSGVESLDVVGDAVFNGGAGGAVALQSIDVSGDADVSGTMRTTQDQSYGGAIELIGDTNFVAGTGIVFDSTVDGAYDLGVATGASNIDFNAAVGATVRVGDVTINSTGTTRFNTAVSAGSLTTDAGGTSILNASSVDTTGAQDYGDAVVVGANTTLTGTAVTLHDTLDDSAAGAHALTIDGDAVFEQAVGGTAALASLATSGATHIDGGSIATTGDQTYAGAVVLGADTTLTGAVITANTAVDGATTGQQSLDVVGDVVFAGDVGSAGTLAALTVSGTTLLNGDVSTAGIQNYGGGVTLANNAVLTTDDGDVTFDSTVDGGTALTGSAAVNVHGQAISFAPTLNGGQELTVNAGTGTVTFNDTIGGTSRLGDIIINTGGPTIFNAATYAASVTTDTPGTVQLNGGIVDTTGTQTYGEIVTVGANTVLTGSTINLQQTLNDTVAGQHTVAIVGDAVFTEGAGTDAALNSLAVSGTSTINGGQVVTTASQSYVGAAIFGADTTLTSGGSVTFGSTLNAPNHTSLNIDAPLGSISAVGAIGGTAHFDQLTLATGQNATFGGEIIANQVQASAGSGALQFNAPVTALTGGIDIDNSHGGTVAFSAAAPIHSATGFVVTGPGAVQLANDVFVTQGPISVVGPLTLVGPHIEMATDGDVTFSGINGPNTILELRAGTGDIVGGSANGTAAQRVILRDMVVWSGATAQLYGTLSNIGGGGTAKFVKGPLFGPPYFFNDVPFGPLEFVDRLVIQTARADAGAGAHLARAVDSEQTGEFREQGQIDLLRAPLSPDLLTVTPVVDRCAEDRKCEVRVISR